MAEAQNKASSIEDTATIQSSDVFAETSKAQSPEVTTETFEAKSSEVSTKVREINFLLYIICVLCILVVWYLKINLNYLKPEINYIKSHTTPNAAGKFKIMQQSFGPH